MSDRSLYAGAERSLLTRLDRQNELLANLLAEAKETNGHLNRIVSLDRRAVMLLTTIAPQLDDETRDWLAAAKAEASKS